MLSPKNISVHGNETFNSLPFPSSPTVHGRYDCAHMRSYFVGRYPGWWNNVDAFPSACSKRSVAVIDAEHEGSSTYRCGGSAGWLCCEQRILLLPVELRRVNHTASTNTAILHGMDEGSMHGARFCERPGQ
jgi:hypothetical protein